MVSVDSGFASQSCLNPSASISLALRFYNSLRNQDTASVITSAILQNVPAYKQVAPPELEREEKL